MDAPDLILALPSKGRLKDLSIEFLAQCGLAPQRSENGREYTTRLVGLKNTLVVYFRPDEIPARVEQGEAHVGITGEDLYKEFGEGSPASHVVLRNLGFGAARLVVAVPQSWIDVTTLNDLDEAAFDYRRKHNRRLRVATKFPRLTRSFFAEHGVADYRIVESLGATEGAPAAGIADFVVDLTSTGTTLAQNHLKEIGEGTILRTEGCLISSLRDDLWTNVALRALQQLVEQVEARMRAAEYAILRFTTRAEKSERLHAVLIKEHRCTVVSWSAASNQSGDSGRYDDVIMCPRENVYSAVIAVRAAGGGPVVVDACEFLFDGPSRAFEAVRLKLKRQGALRPVHEDNGTVHGHH